MPKKKTYDNFELTTWILRRVENVKHLWRVREGEDLDFVHEYCNNPTREKQDGRRSKGSKHDKEANQQGSAASTSDKGSKVRGDSVLRCEGKDVLLRSLPFSL